MSNQIHIDEEIMKMNAYMENMRQDSDRGAV